MNTRHIDAALRRVRGVKCTWVDGCAGELTVVRNQGTAPNDQLLVALKRAGHRGRVLPIAQANLRLKGVNDAAARRRVECALKRVAGVRTVEVPKGACAKVTYDKSRARTTHLVLAVRRAGYEASLEAQPATPPM